MEENGEYRCESTDSSIPLVDDWRSGEIVSLWDMLDAYALKFFLVRGIMCQITQRLKTSMLAGNIPSGAIAESIRICRNQIPSIRQQLEALGLDASVGICDMILRNFPENIPNVGAHIWAIQFDATMDALHKSIERELAKERFYWVDQKKLKYYNTIQFTKEAVEIINDRFDMEEAGACLALACNTACVFHLSRVIEAALRAVAERFRFDYSPTWDSLLKKMRAARDEREKDKKNKQKRDEAQFLAAIESEAHAIKDSWRNPTIHDPARRYDSQEAEDIFTQTTAFMAAVSKGLA